ncbi:hypothetical protein IWW36_004070 [Coemansia brasiliensis]|uniref:DM14 domain-containing protein n=1 Tax=Coemansia brasiliensis TaxID=2650707 RepID=A0A9W8LZE6_9FUNG|nr:hypothetical protein IWW36_004070 [Coemansia brasiliensis]
MYLIAGRRRGSSTAAQKRASGSESKYGETVSAPPAVDVPDTGQLEDEDIGEFDEADLKDPELLNELEALRQEMGIAAPAVAQSASKPTASVATTPAAHAGQLQADHDDSDAINEEEVTEEDMNDPELLAQLSQLAGAPSKLAASKPVASELPAAPAIDEKLASALEARGLDFKQAALSAKRQGQMERAREMLVQMKRVQAAEKAVRQGEQLPSDFVIPSVPAEEPAQQAASSRMQTETASSVQPESASRMQPAANAQPKAKDTATRRAGARAATRAEPGSSGGKRQLAAAHAELSQVTLEDDTDDLKLLATSIEAMEKQLLEQTAEATRLAAYFLKSGDKTRALEFHRLRKQAAADTATVKSLAANGQAAPPILHREVQWRQPAEQRRDIGAGQLQVAVDRVFSEGDLAATFNGPSDFYVQWSLPWPRDKGTRGYTPTLKLRDFEACKGDLPVSYTHSIDMIDRRNTRPLQRWAERARLTVELYKYSGLLWGSQLIGRAVLPLAALRSQSEVSAVLQIEPVSGSLTRAGRPLPGGPVFVHVAARLRLPLSNSPETIVRCERWIYVDMPRLSQPASEPHEPLSGKTDSSTQVKERQVKSEQKSPQTSPVQSHAQAKPASEYHEPVSDKANCPTQADEHKSKTEQEPLQTSPVQSHAQAEPVRRPAIAQISTDKQPELEMDDLEVQMDMVDGLVSNAVLNMELEQIPARIRAAGSNSEATEHLHDLEAAINLRKSVVATLVGAGTLTIQGYMDSVAQEIVQARQWALAAKRGGRKDLAVRALQRIKTMQNEINEMKAAMVAE